VLCLCAGGTGPSEGHGHGWAAAHTAAPGSINRRLRLSWRRSVHKMLTKPEVLHVTQAVLDWSPLSEPQSELSGRVVQSYTYPGQHRLDLGTTSS